MTRHIAAFVVAAALLFMPALAAGQAQDLVAALKATPGCLGVETARTGSGKQVIFAWFENKDAEVPSSGPVLAVASLTPAPNAPRCRCRV